LVRPPRQWARSKCFPFRRHTVAKEKVGCVQRSRSSERDRRGCSCLIFSIAPASNASFWKRVAERIWKAASEARTEIVEGEIFQRDVAHLRAFVISPMQYGRLFLTGDAAHIVPPTGAKGMNLAVADARNLARGLKEFYRAGSREALDRFSERSLRRVWKTVRFSTMLTGLLHKFPSHTPLERELQLAELEYVAGSRAAQMSIAEQYVGVFDEGV
jgi:p-hydroxybenzoate 3-monooxygenase